MKSRDHLYAGCVLSAAVLALIGVVLLWRAVSFEGHIGALLVLAVAALCFVAGRELKARSAEIEKAASPDPSA
ncbi:MAG TPA: hypothetical protein VF211_14235 [Burkholderiales bacterium]